MDIVQSGLKYALKCEDTLLANSACHLKCACDKELGKERYSEGSGARKLLVTAASPIFLE